MTGCEDGWYAGLARHLDSPELRQRLAKEMTSGEEHIRLRAGYVTAMLDDRRTPVRTKNWRRWLTMASS
jgi:hypothetical protein